MSSQVWNLIVLIPNLCFLVLLLQLFITVNQVMFSYEFLNTCIPIILSEIPYCFNLYMRYNNDYQCEAFSYV